MPVTGHIHVCAKCSVEHNSATTYDPPGWMWRGGRLYCDSCASLVADPIDEATPHGAQACRYAAEQLAEIAKALPPTERQALLLLRDDGKGNYDRRLTRARESLKRKGLADSPMTMGFGRMMVAVSQKPTDLGRAVAACLQREAA